MKRNLIFVMIILVLSLLVSCQKEEKLFEIISPTNDETNVSLTPTIKWMKDEKAEKYIVLLYEQPSNKVVFSETTKELSVITPTLTPNQRYKILVKAIKDGYEKRAESYFTTMDVIAEKIDDFEGDTLDETWFLANAESDVSIHLAPNKEGINALNIRSERAFQANRNYDVSKEIIGELSNWSNSQSLHLNLQSDASTNILTVILEDNNGNLASISIQLQKEHSGDLYLKFNDFQNINNLNLTNIVRLTFNIKGSEANNIFISNICLSDDMETNKLDFEINTDIKATYDDFSTYNSTFELRSNWVEGNPNLVNEYGQNVLVIPKSTVKTMSTHKFDLSQFNTIKVTYWTIEAYDLGVYMYISGADQLEYYTEVRLEASSSQFYSEFMLRIPSGAQAELQNLQFKDVAVETKISKIEFLYDNSAPKLQYKQKSDTIIINPVTGAEYTIDGGVTWSTSNIFRNLEPNVIYQLGIRYKKTSNFEASEGTFKDVALSKINLDEIFQSNMILQRNKDVKITGNAEPNSILTLEFGDQTHETTTNAAGRFEFILSPMTASKRGQELIISDSNSSISIENILVGEVWLISGQSNSQIKLGALTDNYEQELSVANSGMIRMFKQDQVQSNEERDFFVNGNWIVSNNTEALGFSGLGYLFAARLYQALGANVPIGIVYAAEGSTNIQNWISNDSYPRELNEIYSNVNYNAMIAPMINLTINGVIWYQGENNANRAKEYPSLLKLLVEDWRMKFDNPDLYFQVIQLPMYDDKEWHMNWAYIREAQMLGSDMIDNCDLIVTMDDGDLNDIHPTRKKYIAERCVMFTMYRKFGGPKVEFPRPTLIEVVGNSIEITIGNATTLTSINGTLVTFEIAGGDLNFVPAQASISGNKIIVKKDGLSNPVYVRYNFSTVGGDIIYGDNNLPLIPFRTDDDSVFLIDNFNQYDTTSGLKLVWKEDNSIVELIVDGNNKYMKVTYNGNNAQAIFHKDTTTNAYEGFEIRFKLENSTKFNLTLNTFKGYPSVSINGTNEWQTVVVKFSEFSGYEGRYYYIMIKPENGGSVIIDKISLVKGK